MKILSKNHPFITTAKKLEVMEARFGITDETVEERMKLKEKYPEFFEEYMNAKKKKENLRAVKEKVIKEIETRKNGCETVSYWKKKKEEQKIKNRIKKI